MSFSESYDACMRQKRLPLLGEIFARKTLSETIEVLDEIHTALESAGGTEITLAGLAAAGSSLGLSADGLEIVAFLGAAGANIAAHLYFAEAASCVATAVIKSTLLSELDEAPDGFMKDQILAEASDEDAVV